MLTPSEVRKALNRAEQRFIDACTGASDEQWRFQPDGTGERAWTIGQVVEHVTSANHAVLRTLQRVVASPRGDRRPDFDDEDMPYLFYGGGRGARPALEDPAGTSARAESITALEHSVRSILRWFDDVEVDLRDYALEHPSFGVFDGAQWMLFAAVHMQQHRGQVLDVKLAAER